MRERAVPRPLRLFLVALAIVGGVWGADALTTQQKAVLLSGGNTPVFGVTIAGPQSFGPIFPTTGDWDYLQRKRIKTVALTIAWENLQTTLSGSLVTGNLNSIKTAIAAANARGMQVIIRLQNYCFYAQAAAWGSTVTTAGNAGTAAANVNRCGDGTLTSAALADLWTKLSTALVGLPGLGGYDIMNEPNPIQVNLFNAPNAFGATSALLNDGPGQWYTFGTLVITQGAVGSNPLGAGYGPPWSLTSGSYGAVSQYVTLAAVQQTLSVYAKTLSGTIPLALHIGGSTQSGDLTVTTSWQRFTFTGTPPAGADNVYFQIDNGSPNQTVLLANAQLEVGAAATAYKPNPWLAYAQAAVTAIRAVDTATPIYVEGYQIGYPAACWPYYNWDMLSLTGGNLIFSAHDYFDGAQAFGDGGSYAGTFTSYNIDTQSAVQSVTPFVQWLQTVGARGQVGEFGVPNSAADNNPQWLPLQSNFLSYLFYRKVPALMEFYGSGNVGAGTVLQVNPQGGIDDPRLVQMLAIAP